MAKSCEAQLIRSSRLRETIIEKNYADLLTSIRNRSAMSQFVVALAGLGGRHLLERTSFSYQNVIFCPDCGRKIPDAKMSCAVRKGNHAHLSPQRDQETMAGMNRLTVLLKEKLGDLIDIALPLFQSIPSATLSCGLYWHRMTSDSGRLAVIHFDLTSLLSTPTTVINAATLTVFSMDKFMPKMVVIRDEHPRQLQQMANITASVNPPDAMVRLGIPPPVGWKRSADPFSWYGVKPAAPTRKRSCVAQWDLALWRKFYWCCRRCHVYRNPDAAGRCQLSLHI